MAVLCPLYGCRGKRDAANTLRVAVRQKFRAIDPAQAGEYYSNIEIARAYEGLLQYHYLKRPYELEPLLAESMPEVSKDRLLYTFRIKKGVRFHDDPCFPKGRGRELTAEDFVYSLGRLRDPSSPGRWILDGKVEAVTAAGTHTLQIRLAKPYPAFLHLLALPFAFVVPREAVQHYGAEFPRHPVGTGPFRLERLSPNRIVWKRNPDYHGGTYPSAGERGDTERGLLTDAGKAIPLLDRIVEDVIVEDQPAWLNFMQSSHDYLMKVPKDNAPTVWDSERKPSKELRDRGIQVFTIPGIDFTYVIFNMEDPVVGGEKNRFLRQAMSLAYDEAPTIETFYLGLAVKAESPVPPGIPGYDPGYRNPNRVYDLAKARRILAKAGHPEGKGIPEIEYHSLADTTNRQLAEYFQRAMSRLGIRVRVNAASWPELITKIRNKRAQVFGISWLYDYPNVENGYQLLYSKNVSPGSNEANYANAGYDALFEKALALPDGPKRRALISKMRDYYEKDVPWIINLHRMETRLAHPWVRNFKIHAFEHNVEKYLRIER